MNDQVIHAYVGNVAYQFDITGHVVPVLKFTPPVRINDDAILTELDLHYVHQLNTRTLTMGDTVNIEIRPQQQHKVTLSCPQPITAANQPQFDLAPTVCPVCGAPLFYAANDNYGRCINRHCSAQLAKYIRIMLAALGVIIDPTVRIIYDNLLTRNSFISPVDIFNVDLNQFNVEISQVDICVFQTALHSIRGSVGIDRLVLALNLPEWSHMEAILFKQLFMQNQWRLPEITRFFNLDQQALIPQLNWAPWNEFIQLPTNRQFVTDLAKILDM